MAIVAAAASKHELPFVCIRAGTRNHFAARRQGHRRDVPGALDAFIDGVERRIDMAEVNGRVFLNNVSLGIYASRGPPTEYRDAKFRPWRLQEVFGPGGTADELHVVDDRGHSHPAVVVVSNNPYALQGPRRPRPARRRR